MLHKLINFLNICLYSEPDFFVTQLGDCRYDVNANNGLKAFIDFDDRIMYVTIQHDELGKLLKINYATPMDDSQLSLDDFVVDTIKNNILFKIPKRNLIDFVNFHNGFFKSFHQTPFDNHLKHMYQLVKKTTKFHKRYDFDKYHSHIYREHKKYQIIYFKRKKILKNIFKYSFYSIYDNDQVKTDPVVYYYVDNNIFHLSDFESFFTSTIVSSPFSFLADVDTREGINDQLKGKKEFYLKHLNLENIRVLKTLDNQYCLFRKTNRVFSVSYITKFNEYTSALDESPSYSNFWQSLLNKETPLIRYKNDRLVTYTYFYGKLKKSSSKFTLDMVKEHEMSINNVIVNKLDYFKSFHPSFSVLEKLDNLGLSTDTPLNQDDLMVVDMFVV